MSKAEMARESDKLALHGGPKSKCRPYAQGRRFGEEEFRMLRSALGQGTLFYAAGSQVREFCREFALMLGARHCIPTSSGTASIHVALGALGISPGDEVITAPITDQGTIIGILFQGALPVFCDIEYDTFSLDLDYLEQCITGRTRAIIPVHLSGSPNDMEPIVRLARQHDIPVIEDCAQAYLADCGSRPAGTIGDLGCFSLNDWKHISGGDGGMVVTDDDDLAHRASLFADKWYDRSGTERTLDYLAPNYRMSELVGAVGRAQLKKLASIIEHRRRIAAKWDKVVDKVPGLYPVIPPEGCRSAYWFYPLRVEVQEAGCDRDTFVKALNAEGVPCYGPYIPRPKYLEPLFTERHAFSRTSCPFDCQYASRKIEYRPGLCPKAEHLIETTFVVPCKEWFSEEDVEETADAILKVGGFFKENPVEGSGGAQR